VESFVKEKLLQLLENEPALAGRPADFIDTLAEDIQAVIIRAISTDAPLDITDELEAHALDIFNDHFGVKLSNLVTIEPFHGKKKLYYTARKRVTLAMIQAMLVEQNDQYDRNDSEQAGETLKHRLNDLALKPTTVN
jgi:hypothetical protein